MVTVQTHMLAVNGNVEAARAGEYGRGFSVVAGDIRSLANESSENADRIKDLVKSIQGQITKVGADIEGAGTKAKEEAERAKVSTANLERIAKDIKEVRAWRQCHRQGVGCSGERAAAGVQGQRADCHRRRRVNRASTESATAAEEGSQGSAGNCAGGRRNRIPGRRTPARIETMTEPNWLSAAAVAVARRRPALHLSNCQTVKVMLRHCRTRGGLEWLRKR